jgi:hypothetical protein
MERGVKELAEMVIEKEIEARLSDKKSAVHRRHRMVGFDNAEYHTLH